MKLPFPPPRMILSGRTLARGMLGLLLCLAAAIPSPAGTPVADEITPVAIRRHVDFLAGPECAGRSVEGKPRARAYIVEQFQNAGLRPLFNNDWLQTVPGGSGNDSEATPDGANIGGFVPGTDPQLKREWIIVNAHYDHLGIRKQKIYPGADDNASGVAMLLEVARRVAAAPLKRSVAFVSFDFEESLLWGSRWFIAHPPMDLDDVKLCLTADMIGRSLGGMDLPVVFILGSEHSAELREALARTPLPANLESAQLGTDMIGTRSDYGPFRSCEIPYLFFSTGEHPDYHSPRDVPERLDYDKSARVNTYILDLVREIGDGAETPRWSPAEYQNLEEARVIHRVAEQVLTEADQGKLEISNVHRFFVSQVRAKTGYMLRQERVTDQERPWLVRSAQVLMLSVF